MRNDIFCNFAVQTDHAMKTELIASTPGTNRLILIFAGWNTDPKLYQHISIKGWDTMVAYDFDGSSFPDELLSPYSTIYLFAWSLGVAAAGRFLNQSRITRRIAVNGTPYPVSDSLGIPADTFNATEATLNQRNLLKFRRRMTGGSRALSELLPLLPETPDIDTLRAQLRLFGSLPDSPDTKLRWHRVYISSEDAIFPAANQHRAWSDANADEIINLDSPHYVDLETLIRSAIPDLEQVGRSFAEANTSYDANALAQQEIAERLVALLPGNLPPGKLHVLELGPGSGIFTRMYAGKLRPASITFVDLYAIDRMNVAPEEEYIIGDAEDFLERADRKWDIIVSSSAIQWFVNIPAFLRNSHRCLTESGVLACSTFLSDNLSELRKIKPSTLIYQSEKELTDMILDVFGNQQHETLNISIRFDNAKEALRHLRATGVGNAHNSHSTSAPVKAINILKQNPTLHYSAYIFRATQRGE